MKALLLVLPILFSAFFICLSFSIKGKERKILLTESAVVFFCGLLFAPVSYLYFSISVQAIVCAFLFFLQFLLPLKQLYQKTTDDK